MSSVRLEGSWYIDQANNRWSTKIYTEERAAEYSDTLTNCSDCTDCKYCRDCQDCDSCIACNNCSNCNYCSYCRDCMDCRYCSNCRDCRNCSYCCYCEDCSYCSDCRRCRDCGDCVYCSNCSCCIDCGCCSHCDYCHNFRENPQRITGWIMGSRNDTPSVYWVTPGEEQCIVGCFRGTLSELEEAVRATHRDNPKHLNDYLKFILLARYYQKSVNDSGGEKCENRKEQGGDDE